MRGEPSSQSGAQPRSPSGAVTPQPSAGCLVGQPEACRGESGLGTPQLPWWGEGQCAPLSDPCPDVLAGAWQGPGCWTCSRGTCGGLCHQSKSTSRMAPVAQGERGGLGAQGGWSAGCMRVALGPEGERPACAQAPGSQPCASSGSQSAEGPCPSGVHFPFGVPRVPMSRGSSEEQDPGLCRGQGSH